MKNILIIGTHPLNFTTEIINELLLEGNQVTVFSSFPPNKNTNPELLERIQFKLIKLPDKKLTKLKKFTAGLLNLNISLLKIFFKGRIKNITQLYHYSIISLYKKQLKTFDIVNFQQLSLSNAWLYYLNKETKIITSFWGSDLLINENKNVLLQKKEFVNRSTYITLQNSHMLNVFNKKYGNHNNVKVLLFPLKNKIFEHIDALKKNSQSKKINIGIGYNANKRQNHLKIINALAKLDSKLKEKISVSLFFLYGGNEEYKNTVLEKIKKTKIDFLVYDKFLTPKQLAEKWVSLDMMIVLQKSDAFSASVSENLYAENLLLTGSWLPYYLYKKNDVYFEEIETFKELPYKLKYMIENFNLLKPKTIGNKKKVLKTLNYEKNLKNWVSLFS